MVVEASSSDTTLITNAGLGVLGSGADRSLRDGTWREINKLSATDGAAQDLFGLSVAISAGNAIIGVPGNSADGPWSGSAYVFQK